VTFVNVAVNREKLSWCSVAVWDMFESLHIVRAFR
jgi:hypothetical protein